MLSKRLNSCHLGAGQSVSYTHLRAHETAAKSLRDLRIAEVPELDMQIENGKVLAYRAKVKISFKYEGK